MLLPKKLIVLIVEDEPLLLMNAIDIVEDAGFQVLEARNADEAILILESRNDVRIVFTDINMPGSMNGLLLSHAINKKWPPIKLIVTSGYFLELSQKLPSGARFFKKPYSSQDISAALHELAA